MSEKLVAGLCTAALIAPLCAVCVLGPAVVASIFTGIAVWIGGFDALVAASLALVAGVGILVVVHRRRVRRGLMKPARETGY